MLDLLDSLNQLYQRIHSCGLCNDDPNCLLKFDCQKVARTVVGQSIASKVMLIGQALGPSTQRLSGLPYTKENYSLSGSGKNLDKFLSMFGYTIDSSDASERLYAYSTDIVQCFPGKKYSGKGDRKPNAAEIRNCLTQEFLKTEISLVKPKLILLMGRASRDTFYEHFLRTDYPSSLSEHVEEIAYKGQALNFDNAAVIPIQHPSGANPKFRQMFGNQRLIRIIEERIL